MPSLAIHCGQSQPSSLGKGAKGAILVCVGSVSTREWRHWWECTAWLVAATGTGCVLPGCLDWHILLILDGWYHWLGVDFPYIPTDTSAVGTYHEGFWEVRQVPNQQPSHGADRRRHGAQHQHSQGPLCDQLRVTAVNRRRKSAAGKMLLLSAQNLLLSQWGVSNRKGKIRVSGLCSYLLWSSEALVQLLMNILHL